MTETHVCGDCGLSVQKMHRYHRDCIAALRAELAEAQQQLQQANGDGIYKANLSRSDYDKILCDAEQRAEQAVAIAEQLANDHTLAVERAEQAEAALDFFRTLLSEAGICICGHDGKLTSADCSLHGLASLPAAQEVA